eukprot:GDKJ01022725.1.p1 GENE.GDKJ01022725.1~~GDKJ01022725.1.p1  ORF type:complete len:429 (-),score=83.97 GDKJ01022725.1:141-1427(-)
MGGCTLLPGVFGIALQGLLAVMAFCSLLIKRYREVPRRPWKIFFLDSSKQFLGSGWLHFLNIVCAEIFSNSDFSSADACEWYWVNIVVDTTIGTVICYYLVLVSEWLFQYESGSYLLRADSLDCSQASSTEMGLFSEGPFEKSTCQMRTVTDSDSDGNEEEDTIELISLSIRPLSKEAREGQKEEAIPQGGLFNSGYNSFHNPNNSHDSSPSTLKKKRKKKLSDEESEIVSSSSSSVEYKVRYRMWLHQLLIWLLIVSIMKGFMVLLMGGFSNFWTFITGWIIKPFSYDPNVKLIFVMVVTPLCMNTFQLWFTDTFLKYNPNKHHNTNSRNNSSDDPHQDDLHSSSLSHHTNSTMRRRAASETEEEPPREEALPLHFASPPRAWLAGRDDTAASPPSKQIPSADPFKEFREKPKLEGDEEETTNLILR